MPTARQRHMITETDECEKWINDAALIWPDLRHNRAALIRRLMQAGHATIADESQIALEARRQRIREGAGKLTGVWTDGWRDEQLAEWPE